MFPKYIYPAEHLKTVVIMEHLSLSISALFREVSGLWQEVGVGREVSVRGGVLTASRWILQGELPSLLGFASTMPFPGTAADMTTATHHNELKIPPGKNSFLCHLEATRVKEKQ